MATATTCRCGLWDALLSAHALRQLTRKGDTVETLRALSLAAFAALVDASQNMISAGRTARTVTAMRRACIRVSRKAVSNVAGGTPTKKLLFLLKTTLGTGKKCT